VALKSAGKLPRILTPAEVQAVLDGCVHLRDRFLFALLYDSGCRVGEALGLRHEDIDAASRVLRIVPRASSNGARVKNHSERSVPISGQLVRLRGGYLHEEYGELDCDYVFVNLFAAPRGQAMTYPAACDLVVRLRARVGFGFDPHWLRHCMVICTALGARGTANSRVRRIVPRKYPVLRVARASRPVPGLSLFAAAFDLTWLTCLSSGNGHLPGTL
jgi:integrase